MNLPEDDVHVSAQDSAAPVRLRSWAPVVTAWAVALSAVAWWLVRVPVPVIREQLTALQFWSLEIRVVIAVVCGLGMARDLARELDRRDVLSMAMLAAAALTLTISGGAPHAPHLLRRADLPGDWAEPLGPQARADVQRRDGRARPAAVLERPIQQAAVRVPSRPEPGVPRLRRSPGNRLRGQRPGDGGDRLCGVSAHAAAVRRCHRGVLLGAVDHAHAPATGVVGHRRGRTDGLARLRRGARGGGAGAPFRSPCRAGRGGWPCGLRRAVPSRVPAHPGRGGGCWCGGEGQAPSLALRSGGPGC